MILAMCQCHHMISQYSPDSPELSYSPESPNSPELPDLPDSPESKFSRDMGAFTPGSSVFPIYSEFFVMKVMQS